MNAGVLYGKNDIRYSQYPNPEVKKDEVLVEVKAVGICGSDIPRVLGDAAHYYPIVLGHEFSGKVLEIGQNVKKVKVGDKVAGIPLVPCFDCPNCNRGNYSLCKNYKFIGSSIQGAFSDYISVPEKNVIKFNESLSYEKGAFFEPSTVGLHGIMSSGYKGGEDVAIIGGGTIGIFTAQWAKIFGAKRVFVFDINEDRLKLAQKMGINITVNTGKKDFINNAMEYTSGKGFGYVFETAGLNITMEMAFKLAANKASVCFIGTSSRDLKFTAETFELMNRKEFNLTGSWMSYSAPFPGKEWDLTAKCFEDGRLKYDENLIYKKMPLSSISDAFSMFRESGKVKGKIMLTNNRRYE